MGKQLKLLSSYNEAALKVVFDPVEVDLWCLPLNISATREHCAPSTRTYYVLREERTKSLTALSHTEIVVCMLCVCVCSCPSLPVRIRSVYKNRDIKNSFSGGFLTYNYCFRARITFGFRLRSVLEGDVGTETGR